MKISTKGRYALRIMVDLAINGNGQFIISLKNISNMPARVKCALLAWHTIEEMI